MTDQVASASHEEAPAGLLEGNVITLELVIDSYRVTGELRYRGAPRRLVDILNLSDNPVVALSEGALDNLLIEGDEPRRFDAVQVHRAAILFAIPRTDSDVHPDPYDIVEKVPVAATITVPGFEITGNVHLLPEIDPAHSNLLGGHHFIPMTEVSVRAVTKSEATWSEPVVIVNLPRVQLFAPPSG